eukprot:3232799-Rhodomonas_salina.1
MDAAIVCSFCVRERLMWKYNPKTPRSKNSGAYRKQVDEEDIDETVYAEETMHKRMVKHEKSRTDARKGLGQPGANTSARAVGRLCARCDALVGSQVAFTSGSIVSTQKGDDAVAGVVETTANIVGGSLAWKNGGNSDKKSAAFFANGGGQKLGQRGREERASYKDSLDNTERKNNGPSGVILKQIQEQRAALEVAQNKQKK